MAQQTLPEEYSKLSDSEVDERIAEAKRALGNSLVILGHHYQRDRIIKFADYTGDSFKLSRLAAEHKNAKYIVFCGVHFMAESADILTGDDQVVILPDMEAGCSMADMAEIDDVIACWDSLFNINKKKIIPITYINSSSAVKAFCGQNGGSVCTSSNASSAFKWAYSQSDKIIFFPDEHLGRNTAYSLGIPLEKMVVWNPSKLNGGLTNEQILNARIILWRGFCCVHMVFDEQQISARRAAYPGIKIIVHPECRFEVAQSADFTGSTEYIIRTVSTSKEYKKWAVGTEIHLVNRLAKQNPDKFVVGLSDYFSFCATMFRISPLRLLWILERLVAGEIVNQVKVDSSSKYWAKIALDRMLQIV